MAISLGVVNEQHGYPVLVEHSGGGSVTALSVWWRERSPWIEQELRRCGAVLFRGFGVNQQEKLQQVLADVGAPLMDYRDGNSPRTNLGNGVYTSTEYPAEFFISLHNELSYSNRWPAQLYFCCATPPEAGGETPLADSRAILRTLDPAIVTMFRSKHVRYVRNLHGGKGFGPSWQQTFHTQSRHDVDRFLSDSEVNIEWRDQEMLRLWHVRPATAYHPVTNDEVWFNQADQFHPSTHPTAIHDALLSLYKGRHDEMPQNALFGDGSQIPNEMLDTIRATVRENIITFQWQRGDLLVIDNMLMSHGRMPFKGLRRILVAMSGQMAVTAHSRVT